MRSALLFALSIAGLSALPVGRAQDGPGIVVERIRASTPPEVAVGNRILTIVRVDLRRYAFRFLVGRRDGPTRTLPEWIDDFHLAGGINAGMFLPNGRPCGYMEENDEVLSARTVRHFDGVIGFAPSTAHEPAFAVGGRGCGSDLEDMKRRFGSVLQSAHTLVDCDGQAQTSWRTNRYSAAAIGVDRDGRAVLVHVRTPYRMQVLSEMLAAPSLGIRGLVYMEGGPEASLVVDAEGERVREMGSYEDGFFPNDGNHAFWELPNVIGFSAR